jgi:hypothetical protein
MPNASTDRAKVYRNAARFLERGTHRYVVAGYSCLAIAKAVKGKAYTGHPSRDGFRYADLSEVKGYIDAYGAENVEVWNFDGRDHRVIALCFMAAMVEAGDA